jgi:hypothetical protein
MLVVVLNDWVTDTKDTSCLSTVSTSLAKSASEGQPIDLVDDDHVDASGRDLGEQLPQRRPVHRSAALAAVVIVVAISLQPSCPLEFAVPLSHQQPAGFQADAFSRLRRASVEGSGGAVLGT